MVKPIEWFETPPVGKQSMRHPRHENIVAKFRVKFLGTRGYGEHKHNTFHVYVTEYWRARQGWHKHSTYRWFHATKGDRHDALAWAMEYFGSDERKWSL